MTPDTQDRRSLDVRGLVCLALAAVGLAVLAGWLLAPGGAGYGFSVPDASRFFSAARLDEIEKYRSQTRLAAVASLLVGVALLALLAIWRGPPVRSALDRLDRRPVLGAGALGIFLSLVVGVASLPFSWLTFKRGRDLGLFTQDWTGWLGDQLLAAVIGALVAGIGAIFVIFFWRRFRNWFWLPATVLIAVYALVTVWLWPVLISPLFNDFTPLEDGPVRSQIERIADESDVDVGGIYVVDASRRSRALNAYVNGIGPTKRVVIYDNVIKDLDSEELSSLIAHELGHVKSNDIYRGLGFALLVIPLGVLFVQLATVSLARWRGDDLDGPAVIPALALFATLAVLAIGVPGNVLSRSIEAHSDSFALDTTGDPEGLIGLQRKLTLTNLSDPDPPAAFQFIFGTHPDTMQRIGAAEAFRQEQGK